MFSFVIQSKFIIFVLLFCYIVTLNFLFFLHARSLPVPYVYGSIESIEGILLSSLALNAILLTSSVNIIRFFASKSLL